MTDAVNKANANRQAVKTADENKIADKAIETRRQELYSNVQKAIEASQTAFATAYANIKHYQTQLKDAVIAYKTEMNSEELAKLQQELNVYNEMLSKLDANTDAYKNIKKLADKTTSYIKCIIDNTTAFPIFKHMQIAYNAMHSVVNSVSLVEHRKTDTYKENYARFKEAIVKHCVQDSIKYEPDETTIKSAMLRGYASDVYVALRECIKGADNILGKYMTIKDPIQQQDQAAYNTLLAYFGIELYNTHDLLIRTHNDNYQRYYSKSYTWSYNFDDAKIE
jgi:hypothetical protein